MDQAESRMSNLRSARAQWRRGNPMAAHDRLPAELRLWLIHAALPWSAESALRLWHRALRKTNCPLAAQAALTAAEARTLNKEKVLR
jgi:Family of unknown function (DUF6525)